MIRKTSISISLFLVLTSSDAGAQSLAIETFAGSTSGGGYNDGQGAAARFSFPVGVAMDAAGSLYVADSRNHVVRKVTRDGEVTTLAGRSTTPGAANGQRDAARFNNPYGVAVDVDGNVYVADRDNHAIRKIAPSGAVTTLAGLLGTSGTADGQGSAARFTYPVGVAVDSRGNVYVADTSNHTVRKVTPGGLVSTMAGTARSWGSSDGFGSQARFQFPFDVVVDSNGNVFVADTNNHLIRRVTSDGRVTTIAGSIEEGHADGTGSAARFEYPWGLEIDATGNIYVADTGNQLIRKITPAGVVTTLVGQADVTGTRDGVGTTALLRSPTGIVFDPQTAGFFVAERANLGIRFISSTLQTSFFAGSIPSHGTTNAVGTSARFFFPFGITADSGGNVYVSDATDTIRKIAPNGMVTLMAGAVDQWGTADGPGTSARFEIPHGLATDSLGNVYIADYGNNTIRKMTPAGTVSTFAGLAGVDGDQDGTGSQARFDLPYAIAVDANNNLYVADAGNHKIRHIEPTGVVTTFAGSGFSGSSDGVGTSASFSSPTGVAVDAARNVYVVEYGNSLVRKIAPNGQVTTVAGIRNKTGYKDGDRTTALFDSPLSIAARPDGILYVVEDSGHGIRRIDANGNVSTVAGRMDAPGNLSGMGDEARLYWPEGICVDNQGRLLIADTYNHAIRIGTVAPPVITSLSATPQVIDRPKPVTIAWGSTGGTTATLNGQTVGLSGSMQFTPTQSTTYILVVRGDGGTVTQSVTVVLGSSRRRSVRK